MVDVVLERLMQRAGHAQRARLRAGSRARVLDRARTSAPRLPTTTPSRAMPVSVSTSMCVGTGPGCRPALRTSVAPIRSIQPPSVANGDWCTCPQSTIAGLVLLDPGRPGPRRRSAACPSSSSATRRAARGTPRSSAGRRRAPRRRRAGGRPARACAAVPPRAHRHQHVARSRGASRRRTHRRRGARRATSRALAELVARVEVVVARARDDGRLGGDAREVLEHDARSARPASTIDAMSRRSPARTTRSCSRRDRRDPVELLQRVVQVGDEQDPHAAAHANGGACAFPCNRRLSSESAASFVHHRDREQTRRRRTGRSHHQSSALVVRRQPRRRP